MKNVLTLGAIMSLAIGCATAQEKPATPAPAAAAPASTAAKANCPAPPRDLVVKDLQTGTGEAAAFRSVVLVGYTGWVYDGCAQDFKGEKFDSSDGRPAPFGLVLGAGRVIKGWDEGLVGMQKGGRRLLVIPPEKAYGARSPTPKIPPNSTLVFEVAMVDIRPDPPPAAPAK